MQPRVRRWFANVAIFLTLVGCTQTGDTRYRVSTIGNASRTTAAIVISKEPVIITRSNSGAGASAGGALGGAVAGENSDNAAVVIAGIVGGAILGSALETSIKETNGHQYVIETSTGALISVAQIDQGNTVFEGGDQVLLIYGVPHRLIPDPRHSN